MCARRFTPLAAAKLNNKSKEHPSMKTENSKFCAMANR
jgi:hypothetical protein